jgi:hypothetical protein
VPRSARLRQSTSDRRRLQRAGPTTGFQELRHCVSAPRDARRAEPFLATARADQVS